MSIIDINVQLGNVEIATFYEKKYKTSYSTTKGKSRDNYKWRNSKERATGRTTWESTTEYKTPYITETYKQVFMPVDSKYRIKKYCDLKVNITNNIAKDIKYVTLHLNIINTVWDIVDTTTVRITGPIIDTFEQYIYI